MRRPSRRISRLLGFTVVPVSLVATGLFVTASSYSVFNATTSNTANNWQAGSVHLSDDDSNGAMFSISNIKPGTAGSRCIVVSTTAGDLPAKVGLYAQNYNSVAGSSTALATDISLTIDMGTSTSTYANSSSSTSTPNCTLTGGTTIYTGNINDFGMNRVNYTQATSVAGNVWQTSGGASAETKVYRIAWSMPSGTPTADNQYQGTKTNVDFQWESQTF